MNANQIKGRVKEVTGAAKEAAGRLTGKRTLQVKGKVENVVGTGQRNLGDAESAAVAADRRARATDIDRVDGDL